MISPLVFAHGGFPSTIPPSMTVTMVPRRLISPHTVSGAPGSLVVRWVGTISRKDSMSQANALPPTSNISRRRVGIRGASSTVCSGGIVTDSLIKSERRKRVHTGRKGVLARHHGKRAREVLRKGGAEIERLAGHGMIEREPGRVEEMALGRKSGHTTSSASAIHVVAHDRMADRREMNADLVSPSGMEMRTKKVPRVEPGKAYEVGLGRPTLIDDCHALPVSRIPGYWLVDRQRVAGEMAPRHDRVSPDHPAGSYRRAQNPMRTVGLCHDEQARGFLVETVHHSRALGLPFSG